MRFWIREIAGWVLVGLGVFVFYWCFVMLNLQVPRYLESGPLVIIGIFLFRGGIHLLKVAVAARVCMHAEQTAAREQPPVSAPPRKTDRAMPGARRV